MATSNPTKQKYIERIRAETTYPIFRRLVGVLATLIHVLGILYLVFGPISGIAILFKEGAVGLGFIVVSIVVGLLLILSGKLFKETSFMLADIADSITDLNCRY